MNKNPEPHEKVCYNCKYMLWMVGIGLGVRCGYEYYLKEDKHLEIPKIIPHLKHTCNKFEFKVKEHGREREQKA
jgi:hypothetical protein